MFSANILILFIIFCKQIFWSDFVIKFYNVFY